MKKTILPLLAVLTVSSFANASGWPSCETFSCKTFEFSFTTVGITSSALPTDALSDNYKEIIAAKEDISYFVASEGEVRTARFEVALSWVKQNFNTAGASDLQIANEMLAVAQ
jgi:Protein of unknown function (DUF2388).